MKPSLADRITAAIQKNDTKTGSIPMGKGPSIPPARTYFSPTDSYEDEIGQERITDGFAPGHMRGMWQVYEQQQAHVPVTNLVSSGNVQNNELNHIQGGIPQNPVAPPATWSQIPQMSLTVKSTGPVLIHGSVTLDSSSTNDTIGLAIYRDGNLIGNFENHTLPTSLKALKNMSAIDNPPVGTHVYAMYWSPGAGTLTAVSNARNFYAMNLTPQ